jgi:hypothetical protein
MEIEGKDAVEAGEVSLNRRRALWVIWISSFGAVWNLTIGFLVAHFFGSQGLSPDPSYFQWAMTLSAVLCASSAGYAFRIRTSLEVHSR